jgi:hypothetical protein
MTLIRRALFVSVVVRLALQQRRVFAPRPRYLEDRRGKGFTWTASP